MKNITKKNFLLSRENSGEIHLVKDKMYHMEVIYYNKTGGETGGAWLMLDMMRPGDEDLIPVSFDYLYRGKR